MLALLVAELDWHGALPMDLIVADGGPVIIDVNPRLVEPANALAAGVDLVVAMLEVASDAPAQERSPGGVGVRTRQTLLAILGAAEQQGARSAVLREAFDAIFARGDYAGSSEELTPVAGDPVAAVPAVAAEYPLAETARDFYKSGHAVQCDRACRGGSAGCTGVAARDAGDPDAVRSRRRSRTGRLNRPCSTDPAGRCVSPVFKFC